MQGAEDLVLSRLVRQRQRLSIRTKDVSVFPTAASTWQAFPHNACAGVVPLPETCGQCLASLQRQLTGRGPGAGNLNRYDHLPARWEASCRAVIVESESGVQGCLGVTVSRFQVPALKLTRCWR